MIKFEKDMITHDRINQPIFQFSKKVATFKSPFLQKTTKLATFDRRHYCSCQQ
jgi:hypothetical protein